MSVQVHKSFFCTATNPRSANSQLMSASVYNFFCCCCNASLTSGGSSCCSLMQLVTSPLQLFPPLLLPLLPACLPARVAVTATATTISTLLLLLLLPSSPLHFSTLPMRQRPWAESPPPLSSPTPADSGAAGCTSTPWPSSSCTSRTTTSVSAAAAAVLAGWLASNGRAPRLASPLAQRVTSCVMTTLLLGVVAPQWFVCVLRVHTSVLRTPFGVTCYVCAVVVGAETRRSRKSVSVPPLARSLAPCNFWCGARARPPRAQTTAVRTEVSRVAACTRHRSCLIIWSCRCKSLGGWLRCKTLQLSCVALIIVKSYLHTPAQYILWFILFFVFFCFVLLLFLFCFLKKSHDSIKENLWICTMWFATGCFIIIFSYVRKQQMISWWDEMMDWLFSSLRDQSISHFSILCVWLRHVCLKGHTFKQQSCVQVLS